MFKIVCRLTIFREVEKKNEYKILVKDQVRIFSGFLVGYMVDKLMIYSGSKIGILPYLTTHDSSTCSVVVITVVSHTTGPQFEPGQVHFYLQIVKKSTHRTYLTLFLI